MPGSADLGIEVVEVGPRDGFQGISTFIATETKIAFVRKAAAAGVRRIEVGSFVSADAVPQMRDTAAVLAASAEIKGLTAQVLVPSERRALEAVAAGARALAFVVSVTEAHNMSNVRRAPLESAEHYRRIVEALPNAVTMRLNVATAFDCPFEGRVAQTETIALLERLIPMRPDAEICLCDTTGRAEPTQVEDLFSTCTARFAESRRWAFHAHDTYGLGLANVYAALRQGVRVFDGSFGGLGGCPFAPGATGNVATEDLVWMFQRMGLETGIDIEELVRLSHEVSCLPDVRAGGRVRDALYRSSPTNSATTLGTA